MSAKLMPIKIISMKSIIPVYSIIFNSPIPFGSEFHWKSNCCVLSSFSFWKWHMSVKEVKKQGICEIGHSNKFTWLSQYISTIHMSYQKYKRNQNTVTSKYKTKTILKYKPPQLQSTNTYDIELHAHMNSNTEIPKN